MFKKFFLNLVALHSLECIKKLDRGKMYKPLNQKTVGLYHKLFKRSLLNVKAKKGSC
jgi:hypothetical protein